MNFPDKTTHLAMGHFAVGLLDRNWQVSYAARRGAVLGVLSESQFFVGRGSVLIPLDCIQHVRNPPQQS